MKKLLSEGCPVPGYEKARGYRLTNWDGKKEIGQVYPAFGQEGSWEAILWIGDCYKSQGVFGTYQEAMCIIDGMKDQPGGLRLTSWDGREIGQVCPTLSQDCWEVVLRTDEGYEAGGHFKTRQEAVERLADLIWMVLRETPEDPYVSKGV